MGGLGGIGNVGTVESFIRVVDKGVMMEWRSGRGIGKGAWRRRRLIGQMGNSGSISSRREERAVRVRISGGSWGFEELLHIELIEIAARRVHRRCRRRPKHRRRCKVR